MRNEIVGNEYLPITVNEIETLISKAKTFEDLRNDLPDQIENLEKNLNE